MADEPRAVADLRAIAEAMAPKIPAVVAGVEAMNKRIKELVAAEAERDELRAAVDAVWKLCDESGPRVMSDGITSYFTLDRSAVLAALGATTTPEEQQR